MNLSVGEETLLKVVHVEDVEMIFSSLTAAVCSYRSGVVGSLWARVLAS